MHSVRLPGARRHLVASQEVIFGGQGQTSRCAMTPSTAAPCRSFMPGVLLAVKRVADLPGGSPSASNVVERGFNRFKHWRGLA